MNSGNWLGLVGTIGLVLLHGLLAGMRAAFASARRGRLRQMADEGVPRAALALRLAEDSSRMLGTLYLGKAFLAALAAAVAALTLVTPLARALTDGGIPRPWADGAALLVVVGGLSALILVVGRLAPEGVAAAQPERWAVRFTGLLQVLAAVLWPPSACWSGWATAWRPPLAASPSPAPPWSPKRKSAPWWTPGRRRGSLKKKRRR